MSFQTRLQIRAASSQAIRVNKKLPENHKSTFGPLPLIVESSRDDCTLGTSTITLELSWDLSRSCCISVSSLLSSGTAGGSEGWGGSSCFWGHWSPVWLWLSAGALSPSALLSLGLEMERGTRYRTDVSSSCPAVTRSQQDSCCWVANLSTPKLEKKEKFEYKRHKKRLE